MSHRRQRRPASRWQVDDEINNKNRKEFGQPCDSLYKFAFFVLPGKHGEPPDE
ncbi:hypothetical protein [Terrimonas pollutisoli]|uniref:hypothetical protein n=1 Tax=Terrimonas pollutisoli TaxID=3034147 RepID=UPI0023ED2AC4|nr:hypothetical protein [Terrimonas sp. H1YJ31]